MNLIPEEVQPYGSYYCTWHHQAKVMKKNNLKNNAGSGSRDALTAEFLFGNEENYHWLPRAYRKGVYLVLDDGWDIAPESPNNTPESWRFFGRVEPDPVKFASLGNNAFERLTKMVELTKELGYAGMGLWIAPQVYGEIEPPPMEEAEKYWISRAQLCAKAGIRYWKVDWGYHDKETPYREMMTRVVKQEAPDLLIEHAYSQKPLHDEQGKSFRREISREVFAISDAFRTYDVVWPMAECSSLARLHEVLENHPAPKYGVKQIPSAEYRYFIAAGLGCAVGEMDESVHGLACLRWEHIAPPFGMQETEYRFSEEMLTDRFLYPKNSVSYLPYANVEFSEKAPAVMVRGCELPKVTAGAFGKPFVCASKNPISGAYALSTVRRTITPNTLVVMPADITWRIEDMFAPVGIFGYVENLTFVYPENIVASARVYAQNLLDDEAEDITDSVRFDGNRLTISGSVLSGIGAFNYSYPYVDPGKIEDPMLVVQIMKE